MKILFLFSILLIIMFASRYIVEVIKSYHLRREMESNTKNVQPVSPKNWYCYFSLDDLLGSQTNSKR